MDNDRRKKVFALLLVGAVLASVAVANFASALNAQGGLTESAVFAKVYGFGNWIDLDGSVQTLLSITLPDIPMSGYYHVMADGYVLVIDQAQASFALGVDSPTEDVSTRRSYQTSPNGITTGVHTERVYHLGPGAHTFYFLATCINGLATVNYHTITVTFYTYGSLTELA